MATEKYSVARTASKQGDDDRALRLVEEGLDVIDSSSSDPTERDIAKSLRELRAELNTRVAERQRGQQQPRRQRQQQQQERGSPQGSGGGGMKRTVSWGSTESAYDDEVLSPSGSTGSSRTSHVTPDRTSPRGGGGGSRQSALPQRRGDYAAREQQEYIEQWQRDKSGDTSESDDD
jgi:hypothetical protein